MTIKEFVETNEKIKKYEEEGKLTIKLASDVAVEEDSADFSDAEDLVLEEKFNFAKTLRLMMENNAKIEQKLHNIIALFENLQDQVDAIEISN